MKNVSPKKEKETVKNSDLYLLGKKDEEEKSSDKDEMFYVKQSKKTKKVDLPKLKSESKNEKK